MSEKVFEAIGWTWAEACTQLDKGNDPREYLIPELIDRAIKELEIPKITPTPRPLSKGDWVYDHNVLFGFVTSRSDNFARLIYKDGSSGSSNISNLTRIDTLTEEHLSLLNPDSVRYKLECTGDKYHVEEETVVGCNLSFANTHSYDTPHEAISECLKSVISRRRLDREMGV